MGTHLCYLLGWGLVGNHWSLGDLPNRSTTLRGQGRQADGWRAGGDGRLDFSELKVSQEGERTGDSAGLEARICEATVLVRTVRGTSRGIPASDGNTNLSAVKIAKGQPTLEAGWTRFGRCSVSVA